MEAAEKRVVKLENERVQLESNKCEKEEFYINLKRIDATLHTLAENM
jgi:hypothetical protein